ncbi:MAG: aldehyde dehydrogenase family protein [Planctomycetaceae bacterium]|jgi:aldehyde dehydrogenase (NAD+)|nr:aldehyde dehydrogenase family protein [Planctomycetaceae bacterium]
MAKLSKLLERLRIDDDARLVDPEKAGTDCVISDNPSTGEPLMAVRLDRAEDLEKTVQRCTAVQKEWRVLPAPVRGEIVRRIGEAFREAKDDLGELVSLEAGKIRAEGLGEIQECIDIADFSVGLSRQLCGSTMHSERPNHRMYEQWHPLGTIGCITAFNFPAAVWAWNAMLAAVCGNVTLWKPSLMTPLVAVACNKVAARVMKKQDLFKPSSGDPRDVFSLIIGADNEVAERMVADRRLPLISATGSCRMGRRVGQVVAGRLGRALLELGGNNAIIVMPDADMKLVERAVLFGAVGTAGQRCTTTRRLIVHEAVADRLVERLVKLYGNVTIGDPLEEGTLMGPLVNARGVQDMRAAIERAEQEGCKVLCGGVAGIERMKKKPGHFVEPTIIRVPLGKVPSICCEETFAPILYVFTVKDLDEAMALQNGVDQGLSSAIFTDSVRSAERFLGHAGSDCGIANVNLGTSGAEIGGAFGGEKDTGGGRESGSDSWKQYMRRQTCTINWGNSLPLAQGIKFGED